MEHNISLITTIAAGFGVALILGFIAERLKVPALVGYLVAGIIIGPATPGFVADMHIASQLSEIGVMLLMFGVGLHFSLNDLLAVKRIAVARRGGADGLGYSAGHEHGLVVGMGLGGRIDFRFVSVVRQHRGAAQGARSSRRAGHDERAHRRRLAGRGGSGDGAGVGAVAAARGRFGRYGRACRRCRARCG